MKFRLIILLLGFATSVFAQRPNNSNRLPITADMPEWAKKLYREDIEVNLYELDKEYAPWKATFDSLKTEMAKAGDDAGDDLKRQFAHYKQYYKYYTRWRGAVYPFVQEDGFLVFSDPIYAAPVTQAKPSEIQTSTWTQLGPLQTRWAKNDNTNQPNCPWQANVYALDVAPSNPNLLYYGTETGVVGKTVDKGLNWTTVGLNYFTGDINAVAINPLNENNVYTGEQGRISVTSDGGATWSTSKTMSGFNTNDLKIKPDDGEVVLAAGSSLIRRTAGNVWTTILSNKTYSLAFKPDNTSIVYALVRNPTLDLCEFWKSTDGGQTFTIRSSGWITGLTDGGGHIAVTPADNNRIYVVLLTGSGPRIMKSTDAGETWTMVASSTNTSLTGANTSGPLAMSNGQGFYDLSIVASHTNADEFIVGTTTAYKSTDGGVNYAPMGGYNGSFSIHPDIQKMVALGSETWIATDGGINLSTDFYTNTTYGVNFTTRMLGATGTEYWGFASGWNEDVLVGGRYHNGNSAWRETYPAGDYLRMGGGEAPTGYVNPGNPSMTYFSDLGGRILSSNINQNFQSFTVTKWPNEDFYSMHGGEQEWDPRYMYTYYIGKGNQFWKTTDNGLSFTALYTHANAAAEISYIEVSRSDPNVIYFTVQATSPSNIGELWKSSDGGQTWTQCTKPGTLSGSQLIRSTITLSGTDPNTLWWGFRTGPDGQKVFKSTDGGATWTNWTTSTLNGVSLSDIVHQLGTDGGVYVTSGSASSQKVYYRDNTSGGWAVHNSNLPLNLDGDFASPFCKLFYKGKKIRLATGNGIWEADFYTPSTTTLVQPMVDKSIIYCDRDTVQLESYSVVNGTASYQWSISPTPQWISNANIRNPKVILGATPGYYSATLTITDDNGVTSRTVSNLINNLPSGNYCSADTIAGKALSLDGSGDFASTTTGNLNLNSNTVSLTAWVKRNGSTANTAGIVFARGGTTVAGLSLSSSNQLFYTWDNAAGSYNFNTGFTVPDNVWTHVALVITPNDATVYMNGVPATRTAAHPAEAFDTPLLIGYENTSSRYFKGLIDEVSVWNKSLSLTEVREMMHLTLPTPTTNLVAYYQFNENIAIPIQDKAGTYHASLADNSTRAVSSGPFGGGKSSTVNVTTSGLKDFTGTGVKMAFTPSCTTPNGNVVVTRINQAPYAAPCSSTYASDNHYWIIHNYGTNQVFEALDSIRFDGILVPATNVLSPTGYTLNRRGVNSDLSIWSQQPSFSIGATGGTTGRISFGKASNVTEVSPATTAVNTVTEFGQFIITDPATTIAGPDTVCSGDNAALDAGAGFSAYSWSNSGGTAQTATFSNLTTSTTYYATVTGAGGCQLAAVKPIVVKPRPTNVVVTPASMGACRGQGVLIATTSDLAGTVRTLGTGTSTSAGNTSSAILGPNPLQNYYGGSKQQMLINAAELTSLGMVSGSKISSIAVNLVTANTAYPLQNLRVKVQSTALTALSTLVTTGWTTVRNPANFTPAVGWNTISFDPGAYYTWDGVSNLLVEINFSNNNAGTSTTNTACYGTVGASVVTLFYRVDNKDATYIDTYTGAANFSYTTRNILQFGIANPPAYTWSPATGLNTTTGANVTATPPETTTYTVTVSNGSCFSTKTVTIAAECKLTGKVLFQGPYNTAAHEMNASLNGLLPLSDPYGLGTTATVNPNTIADIVDWVKIEIRDANTPTTIFKSVAAFVKKDGTLVDIDGSASTINLCYPPGIYHISIKHRNHLGVMTGSALDFRGATSTANINFTTPASAYGSNGQVEVQSGVWAMWGGNVDGNSAIYNNASPSDATIVKNAVLTHVSNTGFFGSGPTDDFTGYSGVYSVYDVNMDGAVYFNFAPSDVTFIENNILIHPANTGFFGSGPLDDFLGLIQQIPQ